MAKSGLAYAEGRMSSRLDLRVPPVWEDAKATWDTCSAYFADQKLDPDVAYALCMVSQELLENAVKYGSYPSGAGAIGLEVRTADREVTIEVKSPVSSDSSGQLKRLDGTIQWIRGFQTPFEAYVERLKAVSAQPYTPGESGLGLVRIAYEGQCILDFYVDDSDLLAISAVYRRA
jgi:hypothetical protein